MKDIYEIANNTLLVPYGITEKHLQQTLQHASDRSIDMADIFLQYSHREKWYLEDGIVKDGSFNIDCGVGIRSVSDVKTGFAYTNDITVSSLLKAAKNAKSVVNSTQLEGRVKVSDFLVKPHKRNMYDVNKLLYPVCDPISSWTEKDKVDFLKYLESGAYSQDKRIKRVMIRLKGEYQVILILNNEGVISADVRPLVSLSVTVIANDGKRYESGYEGIGSRADYNFLINDDKGFNCAKEAARIALLNLEAVNAPVGVMPVVLAPGFSGTILHEAIGHGLEGDFIRKGTSVFTGRVGEKIANSECTIVDNGKLSGGASGSINVDDEGTPTQCNVLIEKGVLKGFMYDKLNARLTGNKSTGNGRRQSYAYIPCPRMTNTYMLPGKHNVDEIINSVKKGIYAVSFSGGEVDITSGKFVFATNEAYLIENGKISYPIKNAMLIGDGMTVLTKISMVGNDLKMDSGTGMCGKAGQEVPAGVGQPTLRVDELTVGGTG